jgi:hypothetical protein
MRRMHRDLGHTFPKRLVALRSRFEQPEPVCVADLSVSLFIIGLAIEDHKRAGGNPIDHSRNTHERGHRGDQIGDCSRHAGQERSTEEPDATEKRYPGSSVSSSYPVSG